MISAQKFLVYVSLFVYLVYCSWLNKIWFWLLAILIISTLAGIRVRWYMLKHFKEVNNVNHPI
jgi:positive regulator of sigma E activity